jgi:hypothetical protein
MSDITPPAGAPDPAELDPEDAFGHPVLRDPAVDEWWVDGDEDDVDV